MGRLWRQGGGRAVRSESYPSQPYSTRSRHDYNLPPKSSFPSRGLVVRVLGRSPCLFFSCFIAKINNRVCNHVFFSFSSLDFQTYLHFCCVCFWLDYVFIARVGARVANVVLHCALSGFPIFRPDICACKHAVKIVYSRLAGKNEAGNL